MNVVMACARCGLNPRYDDTHICDLCYVLEARRVEQKDAEAQFPGDIKRQRVHLSTVYGWTGWSRRLSKGASRA